GGVGDPVAEPGPASVADVHRPGRIRADELDHRPASGAGLAVAEAVALAPDRFQLAVPDVARQPDVEEARPGDLDLLEQTLRVVQTFDNRLRQLARIRFCNLLQNQGRVDREIAVLGLLGRLDLELDARPFRHRLRHRRRDDGPDPLLHHDATVENSFSKSGRSRSQLAVRCSIITLVSPITGMKLVSPFQRGTTCQCTCSAIPAPATRPRFIPTLWPWAEYAPPSRRMATRSISASSSC